MGILYRETVKRRKTPVVLLIAIIIFTMTIIESLLDQLYMERDSSIQILDTGLIAVTGTLIVYEILKCKVVYKYCIIENRLVINKVYGNKNKTVEKILFKDIVYIGKATKYNGTFVIGKRHMGNTYTQDTVCCVYKMNDKLKKFYFQPSESMMKKIERLKQAV